MHPLCVLCVQCGAPWFMMEGARGNAYAAPPPPQLVPMQGEEEGLGWVAAGSTVACRGHKPMHAWEVVQSC